MARRASGRRTHSVKAGDSVKTMSVSRCPLAAQPVQLGQQRLVDRLEPLQDGLCLGRPVAVEALVLNNLSLASQILLGLPRYGLEQLQPAET